MNKPNYQNGSIVNLMSSIKKALGGESQYEPLEGFDMADMAKKNIVLIIIDGLGFNYLDKYGKDSFLFKNLKNKITSVFPSTTVSALTTFASGVAPQQHALTGWFMYLKEIGMVAVTLPFTARAGNLELGRGKIKYKDIYKGKSFFENLTVTLISIKNRDYVHSAYSRAVEPGVQRLAFTNLNGFFRQINKAVGNDQNRKYIFAYWTKLDSLCHKLGTTSQEAKHHLDELDKKIKLLAKSLRNKNTAIMVTGDHGLIDTQEKDKIIELKDHPQFVETLTMPLSGEARVAYCYVRPEKVKEFEAYVKTHFQKYCELYQSSDLIKNNYFGLYKPNPKLKDRVGDYTLVMKDNYIMKDLVPGEEENILIGNHGGMSDEEMFVPLVVIK